MPYLRNLNDLREGLERLAERYTDTCQLLPLYNLTIEGNITWAVRLGAGADGERPAVLLIGGTHAREWVPPEVCFSLAADLLEAYENENELEYADASFTAAQIRYIMETFHLYVVPVCNPDGFEYSKEHDDLGGFDGWRKNRNPADSGGNQDCIGVDINRNYDFLWDVSTHMSPEAHLAYVEDPCGITYHGSAPTSEAETNNIVWLLDTFPRIRWCFDIHSDGEMIMYPWGHDQAQIEDPSLSFTDPSYDGQRGVRNDAYSEYIDRNDLAIYRNIGEEIRRGIEEAIGRDYLVDALYGVVGLSTGSSADYVYARHIADPSKPKVYGFGLEIGRDEFGFRPYWSEAEDIIREVSSGLLRFLLRALCLTSPLRVNPPEPLEIEFRDVPEGLTTFRAIVFEVSGCGTASFRILDPGPTVISGPEDTSFDTPRGLDSGPADTGTDYETPVYARVWISYTGTAAGDSAEGEVRVRCNEVDQEWPITIIANTVPRRTVAVALALDQSGSMDRPAGDLGARRVEVLRDAAQRFVELIPANNAVGLVRFDHDAYPVDDPDFPGLELTHIHRDDMSDVGRRDARDAVRAHRTNRLGRTSIGDGVLMARSLLTGDLVYQDKAMVVFTDGIENRPEWIRHVQSSIDERTFAIGLGTEMQVSTEGLMALAGVRDGYLLLTGRLTEDTDDYFRLTKYFHQILASITRTEIVRDPSGRVLPGSEHRIPFVLSETDVEATVVLLTDMPAVHLRIETPTGDPLDPGTAGALGATYFIGSNMLFYRFGLPLPIGDHGARVGTWHAVLDLDETLYKDYVAKRKYLGKPVPATHAQGIRYNLSVHSYSNLNLNARVDQSDLKPGSKLFLRAVLSEYDAPLEGRAQVVAEIEWPDRTITNVPLTETDPGIFQATVVATQSGLYRLTIRAEGKTWRGREFTREQLLTAAIFRGGGGPSVFGGDGGGLDEDLCTLLVCLLKSESIRVFLKKNHIDPEIVEACLEAYCRDRKGGGYEHPGMVEVLDEKQKKEIQRLIETLVGRSVISKLRDIMK